MVDAEFGHDACSQGKAPYPMSRTAAFPQDSSEARRIVRWTLEGEAAEVVEVAELLVSELMTNAIEHGGDHASLVVGVNAGHVHVETLDMSATVDLKPLRAGPSTERGRGLTIVDALASDWGVWL
jgi:anti-sigma regulatory factor (Ser/Thr protein kinase)